MNKKLLLISAIVLALFVAAASAEAGPPRGKKFRHADRNRDGVIDGREWKKEKQFERKQKSRVNTRWEAAADKDKDGVVEPGEARAWKNLPPGKKRRVVDTKVELERKTPDRLEHDELLHPHSEHQSCAPRQE